MRSSFIARCLLLAGDPGAGVVLYRLNFWQARAKIYFDGRPWVANTYSEWGTETGLGQRAARSAIGRLCARGLVSKRTRMFRRRPTLHLSIADETRELIHDTSLGQHPTPAAPEGSTLPGTDSCASGPVSMPHSGKTYNKETLQGGLQGKPPAGAGSWKASPGSLEEEAEAKLDSHHPKVATTKKLFELYKATMSVAFPETVVVDWSEKEHEKASWLIGALGAERAWRGVRDCVSQWTSFTYQCEMECGLAKTPKKPSITFLYNHAMNIANFEP